MKTLQDHAFRTLMVLLMSVTLFGCEEWFDDIRPFSRPKTKSRPAQTPKLVAQTWQLVSAELTTTISEDGKEISCQQELFEDTYSAKSGIKSCQDSSYEAQYGPSYFLQFRRNGTWEEYIVAHEGDGCRDEAAQTGGWAWSATSAMHINRSAATAPKYWSGNQYVFPLVKQITDEELTLTWIERTYGEQPSVIEAVLHYKASNIICPDPEVSTLSPGKGQPGTGVTFSGVALDSESPIKILIWDKNQDEIEFDPDIASSEKVSFLLPEGLASGLARIRLRVGNYESDWFEFQVISALGQPWTKFGELPNGNRQDVVAFAIADRLYVGGGSSESGVEDDFWVYENAAWRQLADLPGGGWTDTRVEVVGEEAYALIPNYDNHPRAEVWRFDGITEEWTQMEAFPGAATIAPISFSFLTPQAPEGRMYVGGGRLSGTQPSWEWWRYDLATQAWTNLDDLPTQFANGNAHFQSPEVGLAGFGKPLLGAFSDTLWQFEPISESWTLKNTGTFWRGIFDVVGGYVGDKFYYGGGWAMETNEPVERWKALDTEFQYLKTPHPDNSGHSTACVVWQEKIYLLGGADGGDLSNDIWVYYPAADW